MLGQRSAYAILSESDTLMLAIEAHDLHKRYNAVPVLHNLNLSIPHGEVYGLLGPNGTGKSTLLHLLLGFIRPESGTLTVLGVQPKLARGRVGYLPERVRYHTHCTPREYLHDLGVCSNLRGPMLAQRCEELLHLVGLLPAAERRMGSFSKGMLQRLGIAQALLHDPELLLIDEPTSGLDPAGQQELIDLLSALRSQKRTILLCSHQLAEITVLCDRVGILSKGRLALETRLDQVETRGHVVITTKEPISEHARAALVALQAQLRIDACAVYIDDDDALQARVLRVLLDEGARIAEVRPAHDQLIDLYRHVTGGT